jgi:hypothetical protein
VVRAVYSNFLFMFSASAGLWKVLPPMEGKIPPLRYRLAPDFVFE